MKRSALLLTLLSYIGCILVLTTTQELLPGAVADYASVPALITVIVLGAYWFFKEIHPGALGRFFAVLAILFLIIYTGASTQASPTGTRNQAAGTNQLRFDRDLNYAGNCFLTPVPATSQSSSGYAVATLGRSEAHSQGFCNGVGYIDTSVRASGVFGRADATSTLTFLDPGIFPATNTSAQSYILNVAVDFVLNGWQVSHGTGFPVASSSINLSVEFDIIDERGTVIANFFGDSWQGSQNFATGDLQLSYRIGLMSGHIYSAILKFTETASAAVYALAGDAGATGCFDLRGSCSADPFPFGANGDFCPATTPTGGLCQDFEWRSMVFSLTAV